MYKMMAGLDGASGIPSPPPPIAAATDTSDWIALAAFAVAAATFLWKFIETYIRWPRVGVVMRQHITISVGGIPSGEAVGTPSVTRAGDPPPPEAPPSEDSDTETTATSSTPSEPPLPERHGDTINLIVVNNGAEAASVANVGVRSEDRSRDINVQSRRDQGQHFEGPDFPARVEAHGALVWVIPPAAAKEFPRGTAMVGYLHRYKTIHQWPYRITTFVRVHDKLRWCLDRWLLRKRFDRWMSPFVIHETVVRYVAN